MNVLRLMTVGTVVLLFGVGARAEDKPDYAKLIVGKWEATKTDPGTLPEGTVVEFTKDGKLKMSVKKDGQELNVEGTYKVEGNSFTMTMKLGDQEKSQKITITKISDTAVSTTDKDNKVVELKRKK